MAATPAAAAASSVGGENDAPVWETSKENVSGHKSVG